MFCRVFPGSRSLLHSHLHDAGYSYIGTLGGNNNHDDLCMLNIVAEKDDLFAQSRLLEGEYKFSREEVLEEDWPEFSFWDAAASNVESKG